MKTKRGTVGDLKGDSGSCFRGPQSVSEGIMLESAAGKGDADFSLYQVARR